MEKQQVSKDYLISKVEKIYQKPEKAIEYSFKMIKINQKQYIEKKDFVNYVKSCYYDGVQQICGSNPHERFKKNLKQWLQANDQILLRQIGVMFEENAQTNKQYWTFGDFKRWILSKERWFIYIQLNEQTSRIPLHLLGIFGINHFQIS